MRAPRWLTTPIKPRRVSRASSSPRPVATGIHWHGKKSAAKSFARFSPMIRIERNRPDPRSPERSQSCCASVRGSRQRSERAVAVGREKCAPSPRIYHVIVRARRDPGSWPWIMRRRTLLRSRRRYKFQPARAAQVSRTPCRPENTDCTKLKRGSVSRRAGRGCFNFLLIKS